MAKRIRTPDEYDSPWKEVLQAYLPAFLTFFFADIHADVDWSRGYESLDKEFQKIVRRAKVGKRIADKLFKVWLKDGSEHWLLIHVEVQGDVEAEFPRRMFEYNSAVRQLYNKDVVSLAILTDDQPDWRPTSFAYGRWGCRTELTFRNSKLLDFAAEEKALEESGNPFAAVVLAHCKTLETRRDPESRRQWKMRIVKGLFRHGWSKEQIQELFRVIDWMMALPEELEIAFIAEYHELPEKKEMRYVTSVERHATENGLKNGLRTMAIESIALDLGIKFGRPGRKLLPKVRALEDVSVLRRLMRLIKRTDSLDQVATYLNENLNESQ
jgi:hypothetical protein